MTPTPALDPVVRLDLPASSRFLAAARVVATSLGAEVGFSIDDLDDLRLGVNELLSALIVGADAAARIRLEFRTAEDAVTVTGELDGTVVAPPEPDELTTRIVAAVADRYELRPTSFVFAKVSSLREHI